MKKSIVASLLLIVLSTSLFSCGSGDGDATTAPPTGGDTTSPVETTAQVDTTSAPDTTDAIETTDEPETIDPRDILADAVASTAELSLFPNRDRAVTIPKGSFSSAQGACTDGTYAYLSLRKSDDTYAVIYKVELSSGEIVKTSELLHLCHCNDMTYNSKTNQILVCHNAPEYTKLSIVDPETLTVTDTLTMSFNFYSIDYDADNDRYVFGISGGWKFRVLDADFNTVAEYTGIEAGTRQGVYCDSRYIYFILYNPNVVNVYDWNGEFVKQMQIASGIEPETAFWYGDSLWMYFNSSGGRLYKMDIVVK